MKRLAIAVSILAIGAAGCGSSTPTTPSNLKIFTVQMASSNEVPPVTNAEAGGKGTAVITVNSQANTIDFNVSMSGFPAGSQANVAHIHPGAAGVNGAPLVNTGLTAGTAIVMPAGSGTFSLTGVPVSADKIAQILANPSAFYFNVHTSLNPGGAIRGQLQ
jgi:hypothetical protein